MSLICRKEIIDLFLTNTMRLRWLLTLAILSGAGAAVPVEAASINKCIVNGEVTYQDTPCNKQETAEQWDARQKHYESLYQKLDQLAAQGYGMVQRAAPKPPAEPPPAQEDDHYISRRRLSYAELLARNKAEGQRIQQQTIQKNAESAAWLDQILTDMKTKCGKRYTQYPAVGMSDADFRNCTVHAHFGGMSQVVVSKDGEVPLRLYVFPSQQAARVYTIDGVVTAIRP